MSCATGPVPAPHAAPWRERASPFACASDTLLGIICEPARQTGSRLGVLIVVGGPQYRAGSHRLFVRLARELAACGVPSLRFDVRGMGDSTGEPRSFEALDDDIGAAIGHFATTCPGVERVVLWGLCDAASAALLYVDGRGDPRVAGLALLNPWVRTASSQARTQVRHYYWQRLGQAAFWRKLLVGGVGTTALRGLWGNLRAARAGARSGSETAGPAPGYVERMARSWARFPGPILLTLSRHDYTAKEFADVAARQAAWRGTLAKAGLRRQELPTSDHTVSDAAGASTLAAELVAWLSECVHAAQPPAGSRGHRRSP